jgi:hypothetical protein
MDLMVVFSREWIGDEIQAQIREFRVFTSQRFKPAIGLTIKPDTHTKQDMNGESYVYSKTRLHVQYAYR